MLDFGTGVCTFSKLLRNKAVAMTSLENVLEHIADDRAVLRQLGAELRHLQRGPPICHLEFSQCTCALLPKCELAILACEDVLPEDRIATSDQQHFRQSRFLADSLANASSASWRPNSRVKTYPARVK